MSKTAMNTAIARITLGMMLTITAGVCADPATFDDNPLPTNSYWNGSDGSGGFASGSAAFNSTYTDWGSSYSWGGFAYSNRTDSQTTGYGGQYTAITGSAQGGANYAVAYCDVYGPTTPTITFGAETAIQSLYVTNNNVTYYTLHDGDAVFGLSPFDAGDWFELTITGKNSAGGETGHIVVALADFRDGKTEILNTWQWVDLSTLGQVKTLEFSLASSDTGEWGMNTPAYFALDTLVTTPEPASLVMVLAGSLYALRVRRKKGGTI